MTIITGTVKQLTVKDGDKLSVAFEGTLTSGAPVLLDDPMASTKLLKRPIVGCELHGLDLCNQPNGVAFVVPSVTLKQPKDPNSSIPDARVTISIECTRHDDVLPLVMQIADLVGGRDAELTIDWKEEDTAEQRDD